MDKQAVIVQILILLNEQNRTQKWLSDKSGIRKQHVSGYLTGKVKFGLKKANQMLAPLGYKVKISTSFEEK